MPGSAAEWLIALRERPQDAALARRFAEWLEADPAHAEDFAEIERTYAVLGQALTEPPVRVAPCPVRRRRAVAAIGAMAVAACLAVFVVPEGPVWISADAATGIGETRDVRLSDGTGVRLAPDSAVAVAMTDAVRQVEVLKGRAFFEVRSDPQRPFRVTAGALRATVVGTAFETAHIGGASSVSVQEGVVRAETGDAATPVSERLEAGDTLRLTATGSAVRGRLPVDEIALWRQGLLVAHDRPVAEVVNDLRSYFDGALLLYGRLLADQPLTGVYGLSDPAAALQAIAAAQGASVYRISPWLMVIAGD